ncbi:MAG: bifunctional acyl-ACP--phospholipid O-acyltransferase/long-chain-fatty-acid--ACP ligase [Bryobacteraceae bacterium]
MARFLVRLLLRFLFRYQVRGSVPQRPPEKLLILCNHQSFLDPAFVYAYCPFDVWWITHTQIAAQWHFRIILRFFNHLVVDTASPLAMKQVIELINSGKPVCLFPEGRLTTTGSLMKVYDGAAFVAIKTGAKVLPVNIDGAVYSNFNRLKPPFPRIWRPRVTATFFPLTEFPEPEGRTSRIRRRIASHQIRQMLERNWFEARPPTTLFASFLDAVELFGRDHEALSDIRFQPDAYGNVLRGALALGRLTARSTAEQEHVGLIMPNASPTVMLLLGLFCYRRVPAMINYTSGVEGMQSAIDTARIKTIFTSRVFLEKARLTEKVAALKNVQVIALEDLRPQFGIADKAWLMLYALRHPEKVMRRANPEDPAVILFTSGSEGKPKGVVLSHASILANINQIRAVYEFSNNDKFLAALPLFHSFGLTACALLPILTGAKVFLYPSPLHYRMIPEMCYDQDCTVLFGTGTFLAKYARFAHEYDFYSIRYVISGAERLQDTVRQTYAERFGIRVMEGYGVTECSPVVSVNTPLFSKSGSVGRMMPGIEHRVLEVPGIDRGGMLHLKGPNLMLGYLKHDAPGKIQPPSSSLGPGWYETGDIVEVDDEGFVTIIGRVKRFAKVAGEMVSLEVVEKIAATASADRAHAATTVSSVQRGEVILLYTEDRAMERSQLLAAARESGLPEIAVPRQVVHVDKLPRLGNGKVDYVALKEMAGRAFPDPQAGGLKPAAQ